MESDNEPVLEVTAARKSFGATQALDGAELTLLRGEWLALLGPNGAGKTTLLRAIAGRVRLDEGDVSVLGTPLAAPGSHDPAALGVVPQEAALYPLLTAAENLRAFGALCGLTGRLLSDRVRWALGWTGLEPRRREQVRRYSGGMRRRLNLACGVLHRPRVVLLDEPTAGVDPQSRERIWEMLEGLQHEGASLLLTTHQLDEAQQTADRIVIIDRGRTVAAGTFEELLRRTVGPLRKVTLIPRDPGAPPIERSVEDLVADLPPILEEARAGGLALSDLRIHTPSLQEVFLHLTGRELRE